MNIEAKPAARFNRGYNESRGVDRAFAANELRAARRQGLRVTRCAFSDVRRYEIFPRDRMVVPEAVLWIRPVGAAVQP